MDNAVSISWLQSNLSNPNLILLEASLKKTITGTQSSNSNITIPGARYFDLKANFSDQTSEFPNTVPTADQFQIESRKLGINANSEIVVFDNKGIYSSPRVWWLFKIMGHNNVAIVDGGLPEWIASGFPTAEIKQNNFEHGNFVARFQDEYVYSYNQIKANSIEPKCCVVDARSKGRFEGKDPEPRPKLKSGSIPGSINIPFQAVLENGKFKSKKELQDIFKDRQSENKELVFSCGSGLTACIVMLAGEIAFNKGMKVYDGSWTEWANKEKLFTEV